MRHTILLSLAVSLGLSACSTASTQTSAKRSNPHQSSSSFINDVQTTANEAQNEIVLYSLSLLGIDYQFGGNNPEAGLDCSGMVNYIYRNAIGMPLPRTAASIAQVAKPISDKALKAGDLVFFNTTGKPYSHMGIYMGHRTFIHAPRSNSKIRTDSLDNRYFAQRYVGARTMF
jgi:cell wall-associated NlpC family hydrolase